MSKKALPCIVCGAELENVTDDSENQPYEGTAFLTHGHYGSTAFDPFDGSYLEVNICDACLMQAQTSRRGALEQGRKGRFFAPGPLPDLQIPENVGMEVVDRPLVPWNGGLSVKPKLLSPNEALLVTRYRLGWFRIVRDAKGWRVVMNK